MLHVEVILEHVRNTQHVFVDVSFKDVVLRVEVVTFRMEMVGDFQRNLDGEERW